MKLGIRYLIFLIVFVLFHSTQAYAQMSRLYSIHQGLKNSEFYGVDIDSHGFAWIAAKGTVSIFAGREFTNLPVVSEDGKTLFQAAYRIKEHSEGMYWVCSSHGLYLLNAKSNTYERINTQANEDSIYGVAANNIIDYTVPNRKLVTTDGFSVFVLNSETNTIDESLTRQLVAKMKNCNFTKSPLIDKHKLLWYFSDQGDILNCLDLNKMQEFKYTMTPDAALMIKNSKGGDIIEVGNDVYIGTSKGLLIFDRKKNEVYSAPETNGLYITSLVYTKNKDLIIGTDSRGIWHKLHGQELTQYLNPDANFEIAYGKVVDIDEDEDGNLVCLFYEKGVVVIPSPSECFHYHAISPKNTGKNATSITSMALDKHENYWVGTDGCGVFVTDGMKLATAHTVNDGLHSLLIQSVAIDKHGTAWAASYGGGVQYYEGGRWTTGGWLDKLSDEFSMTLYYDERTDKMYLGTNGNGLYILDIAKKSVTRFDEVGYNPWLSAVLVDKEGTLWLGTSLELSYYNKKKGLSGTIVIKGERLSNVSCIYEDGDNVCIGSDKGLCIVDSKTLKQKDFTTDEGLLSNNIKSITSTPVQIWASTRNSLVSLDKETYNIRNYTSFGGYNVGEFHRNSVITPGHHFVLFGGGDGIICFQPKLIVSRKQTLDDIYFTGIKTALGEEELDASILYAERINLKHNNNSFTLTYACPDFGDPYRIHFDYILKGWDKDWHMDYRETSVSYSSIRPGKYTFIVRAYLEDVPDEYVEKEIVIYVSSPWYSSTWALIAYTLIFLIALYYLNRFVQNRKKEKEMLRRTEEVDRMKEAKLNLFTSITHELRSPLMMIESPLHQLMLEDKDAEHQGLYSVMMRNCNRLLGIVKQITDIRKIDSGQFTLKLEEVDYVKYADDVFEQFRGVATVKNISFIVEHAEEELPMMLDATHFEKIITNLLSNAFKFTPEGGKIIVRSGVVGANVELRFYNSGSHIDENDLSHLWERFYQGSNKEAAAGSGIGLNLVYELTKLHHGTINAMNIQPDGVEFTLHFPYFNSQPSADASGADGDMKQKYTILLVDDDSEIIDFVRKQLEGDYNVITAFSGNSGWKQVLTKRPDVVITDYRMPDGNGVELSQLIKSNPETDSTPIILVTGEGDETLQLHSLNIQVDHYLEKPVNIMVLRSAISQVLRVRENLRNKVRRTELGSEMPHVTIENADDKLFARINEAIRKHLDDSEYSVMQLSEDVGISRIHLNRKMKERYGMSPSVFLRSFRLKQAASLLINNKVNVSEVAYRVGFSSHSYFTVSFHDYFGMSPKEFTIFYSDEANNEALQKLLN